jgi:hypothetical protein
MKGFSRAKTGVFCAKGGDLQKHTTDLCAKGEAFDEMTDILHEIGIEVCVFGCD